MTTTRNKITISETMHTENITRINSLESSEYIRIFQDDDIIVVRTDEIPFLISSLQRFLENGEITKE